MRRSAGTLIKKVRLNRGLTQKELAKSTKLSERTIQRIENEEVVPSVHSLKCLSKALDINFQKLRKTKNLANMSIGFLMGIILYCRLSNKLNGINKIINPKDQTYTNDSK
jgi:transcriptional regulator with XRE-family HTH domain